MKILSKRHLKGQAFWDIVFEWEKEFSKVLNASIIPDKAHPLISKIKDKSPFWGNVLQLETCFSFELGPYKDIIGHNNANVIPLIIDFHLNDSQVLPRFCKEYSHHKIVLISNLEVVKYLRDKKFPFSIQHLGLSLPDKYRIDPSTSFDKEYDVVMLGRTNPVLAQYLTTYIESHPQCTYIKSCKKDDKFACIDKDGNFVGYAETREEYINMIRKCRVALYGTPGIDGGEARTGGFNQVTPKFLEYIACGCHVLARYPKNADTVFYEMDKITSNIKSYEQFEKAMDTALSTEVNMAHYSVYLEKHYTSVRARRLQEIMNTL